MYFIGVRDERGGRQSTVYRMYMKLNTKLYYKLASMPKAVAVTAICPACKA